jgi:hypothetical protein
MPDFRPAHEAAAAALAAVQEVCKVDDVDDPAGDGKDEAKDPVHTTPEPPAGETRNLIPGPLVRLD